MAGAEVSCTQVTLGFGESEPIGHIGKSRNVHPGDPQCADMPSVVVRHCEQLTDVLYGFTFAVIVMEKSGSRALVAVQHEVDQVFP